MSQHLPTTKAEYLVNFCTHKLLFDINHLIAVIQWSLLSIHLPFIIETHKEHVPHKDKNLPAENYHMKK